MATFVVSSFGVFVMNLFAGLFTVPSGQTFVVLAYGWAVAGGERQTTTTYLWLSGATQLKHFSCYYTFLGGALDEACWALWARIIRGAAGWVPLSFIREAHKRITDDNIEIYPWQQFLQELREDNIV